MIKILSSKGKIRPEGRALRKETKRMNDMEINIDQVAQQCIDTINKRIKSLNKLNIVVIGKSGVGKSTLINSIFRGNFAETGLSRPVTQEIKRIEKKDYPLVVYDTQGFEQINVKDEVMELINKGGVSEKISEAIHCIWYCINVGGNQIFDKTEIRWLRELTESNRIIRVPVIVVLTQSCPKKKAKEMKSLIEQENLDIQKVVLVLAQDIMYPIRWTRQEEGIA